MQKYLLDNYDLDTLPKIMDTMVTEEMMSINDEDNDNSLHPSFNCAKSTQMVPKENRILTEVLNNSKELDLLPGLQYADDVNQSRNRQGNIPDEYEELMMQNDDFDLQYREELDLMDSVAVDDNDNAYAKRDFKNKQTTPVLQPKDKQDNIPVENEELMLQQDDFDLQYQEQLGLMKSLSANTQAQDISEILNASHLSRISFDSDDDDLVVGKAPVNRRLFDSSKKVIGISFDSSKKQNLASIESFNLSQEASTSKAAAKNLLLEKRNKRCIDRDLFDIYLNEEYEDPQAKKARTEKERDLETISKLLETRNKIGDTNQKTLKNETQYLQELYEFKCRNLSITVPAYPSLSLLGSNQQRIFVRYHNEKFESCAVNELRCISGFESILGAQREHIWKTANDIIVRRLAAQKERCNQQSINVEGNISSQIGVNEQLWVEKYKPRKYVDLLSDETANRNLLTWLKMWDRVVFGREFKTHEMKAENYKLSNFNKRTGKFELNGGWHLKKQRFGLNTKTDELGRPMQKIALLCGPPGVGKTTLAHTIAKHAGYVVREINASDDRSPDAFKLALENGTKMTSVLNKNNRPNCIILDLSHVLIQCNALNDLSIVPVVDGNDYVNKAILSIKNEYE